MSERARQSVNHSLTQSHCLPCLACTHACRLAVSLSRTHARSLARSHAHCLPVSLARSHAHCARSLTHSLTHSHARPLARSLTNLSTYSCHKRLSISQSVHRVCTILWDFLSFHNFPRYKIFTPGMFIAKLALAHTYISLFRYSYRCKICHHPRNS